MGYAVFTCAKGKGGVAAEGGLSAHIERQIWDAKQQKMVEFQPKSVIHPELTESNKEYILLDGTSRSEAIEKRIKEAGITRKIRKDQVRCLAFLCTSDKESMDSVVSAGRIDDYASACIDFCKKAFGDANVVSAVLHMDETTPHLHISVVPIVEGQAAERSETKKQQEARNGKAKRKYSKQQVSARLCAKEVFTPENAEQWQTEFVDFMRQRGFDFERGVHGSKAKHVNPADYNAAKEEIQSLHNQKQSLAEDVDKLQTEYESISKEVAQQQKAVYGLTTMIENLESQRTEAIAKGEADLSALDARIKEKKEKLSLAEVKLESAQKDLKSAQSGVMAKIFQPSKYKNTLDEERKAGAAQAMNAVITATGLVYHGVPSPENIGKAYKKLWDEKEELAKQKAEAEKVLNSKIDQLTEELDKARKQADEYKGINEGLLYRINVAEQDVHSLEIRIADMDEWRVQQLQNKYNLTQCSLEKYQSFLQKICGLYGIDAQRVIDGYDIINDENLTANEQSIAWCLLLGYIKDATTIVENQGGGTSPEALRGWRDKDDYENYAEFARRCVATSKTCFPSKKKVVSYYGGVHR